jgi:hypothetical protein
MSTTTISPLRQRMIEDMTARNRRDNRRGPRPRSTAEESCREHWHPTIDAKKGNANGCEKAWPSSDRSV